MEIIDVSVPLREGMVTYPGDPVVELERAASIAEGSPVNLTRIDFGLHSGTHVDAPVHFLDGAEGIDQVPLDALIGPCEVVEAPDLTRESVARAPEGVERVLFKTPNSELWASDEFAEDFARLDGEAARLLVERGVRLVGVDYLSVGDEAAHHALLEAGVVPVEGLDLRGVEPGRYELVCLPLRVVGADGAPARAVLIRR
ncbi:MAG TPA: cyclase family protein [Gaiellaceae bacterium]|nr:cyclase family protein [Gaiellaceae bacterium]